MEAFETFQRYMGTGLILIWYLLALIFLYLKEEQKSRRVLFLYTPALILLLFFNPLCSGLFGRFLGIEIYFRVLWLLPVVVTLAYTMVKLLWTLEDQKRMAFGVLAATLVIFTGRLVYLNPLFSAAQNVHHVPREVVEICDKIRLEGREVKAAFPSEFLLYVRQYTAAVCMPYGREMFQNRFHDLYIILEKNEIDVEQMALYAKQEGCHYVIFSTQKSLKGDPKEYFYELYDTVGDYVIYRDATMDFRTTLD